MPVRYCRLKKFDSRPRRRKIRQEQEQEDQTEKVKVEKVEKVEEEEEVVLANSLADMCLMRCEICQSVVRSLRKHVRTKHQLSSAEYRQLNPQPVHFVRKTFHR